MLRQVSKIISVADVPQHEGAPSLAINLKGSHGSGKSTLAMQMIELDLNHAFVMIPGFTKPMAVHCPAFDFLIVGRYLPGRNCGGCDALDSSATMKHVLTILWRKQPHLLFEGIIAASIKVPFLEFLTEKAAEFPRRISFCFLDTPLELCLERIRLRNGGKPIVERIVASKHRIIARHRSFYVEQGVYCPLLDATNGTPTEVLSRFLNLYGVEPEKLPGFRVINEEKSPNMPDEIEKLSDDEEAELARLIGEWNLGAQGFWDLYKRRAEIMYSIWKLTAHRGRKGRFSATLRLLEVPQSTAWDLVGRHKIAMGEIPDDEADDDRDDLDEPKPGEDGPEPDEGGPNPPANKGGGSGGSKRKRSKGHNWVRRTVTLVISGELATALDALRAYHHCGNDRDTLKKVVLNAYQRLTVPMLPAAAPEPDEDTLDGQDAA
jgi:P-loop Nucleotide Kinase1